MRNLGSEWCTFTIWLRQNLVWLPGVRNLLISQNVILYNNLRSKLAGTPFLAIFLDGFSEPRVYGFHIGWCSEDVSFASSQKCVLVWL